MSLNWDLTEVQDWKSIAEGEERVITNLLIWATIPVMIGQITAENWENFFARLDSLQREYGPSVDFITREHVRRRIGLRTNVGTVDRRTWIRERCRVKESELETGNF